jgi:hypothetical protein
MKFIICCFAAVFVLAGCSHNPPKPSGDWYYVNPAINHEPKDIINNPVDNKSDNKPIIETKSVSGKSE